MVVYGRTVDWYDTTKAVQTPAGYKTIEELRITAPGAPNQILFHQRTTIDEKGATNTQVLVPWSVGAKTAPEHSMG